MGVISDKHEVLSDNNEETNNVYLDQQMNLIKLEDLNVLPLEGVRTKLDKKDGKMTIEDVINEIGEGLDLGEIETNLINNIVP